MNLFVDFNENTVLMQWARDNFEITSAHLGTESVVVYAG